MYTSDATTETPHLPTELLIAIIDHVDADEDLLTLALTSRRLHALSFHQYFHNHNFNPYSGVIEIYSAPTARKVLAALPMCLDTIGASIEFLSYYTAFPFDTERVMTEIRLLTRYIPKLTSLKRSFVRLGFRRVELLETRPEFCLVFLNAILRIRPSELTVVSPLRLSSNVPQLCDLPDHSAPSEWLENYRPVGHDLPREPHLSKCSIECFPQFLRPFYFHTLSVNSNSIVELTFRSILEGERDWAMMLTHLHFPHLRRFALTSSVIQRDPVIAFLAKHPGTLTEFRYSYIRYRPAPDTPAQNGDLVPVFDTSLEKLTVCAKHVIDLLPSFASMSRLTCVQIIFNTDELDRLDQSLKLLALCTTEITLELTNGPVATGLGVWFANMHFPGKGSATTPRPETSLHCVENLVMDNGDKAFKGDNVVAGLCQWVGLFPKLKSLCFRGIDIGPQFLHGEHICDDDFQEPIGLMAMLRDIYPGLSIKFCTRDPS